MIIIFNRRELICTFGMKEQGIIRNTLSQNGIDYTCKVINRRSSSPLGTGTRGYTGVLGEQTGLEREYIFYVKKNDYERARELVGGGSNIR